MLLPNANAHATTNTNTLRNSNSNIEIQTNQTKLDSSAPPSNDICVVAKCKYTNTNTQSHLIANIEKQTNKQTNQTRQLCSAFKWFMCCCQTQKAVSQTQLLFCWISVNRNKHRFPKKIVFHSGWCISKQGLIVSKLVAGPPSY